MALHPRYFVGETLRCKFNSEFVEATLHLNYDVVTQIVGASLSFLGIQWRDDIELEKMTDALELHQLRWVITGDESTLAAKFLKLAITSGMTIGEIINAYGQIMASTGSWIIKNERKTDDSECDGDADDSDDSEDEDDG